MDTKLSQNMAQNPGAFIAPGFGGQVMNAPVMQPGVPNAMNTNVLLNPAAANNQSAATNIPQLIQLIKSSNPQQLQSYVPMLQMVARQDMELGGYINQLIQAIQFNNDPKKINPNMQTVPGAIAYIENYMRIKDTLNNMNTQRTAQIIKKKKKTRGNPFRVLMGKVGKLLDHGLSKKEIVKHVSKLKYWNRETIEKAVDIVKSYNKKKHAEAVAATKRLIVAEAKEMAMLKVNYDILSTPDLLMRKAFLEDCVNGVELGSQPETPNKELGVINKILEERSQL